MGRELWTSLGDSVAFHSHLQTKRGLWRTGVSGRKYKYQLFRCIYLWSIRLLINHFLPLICVVILIYFLYYSLWRVSLTETKEFLQWFGGQELDSCRYRCSAVYLWLKSYLVVKISSDIVTKHWYQICVLWLSMMSLPPRLWDLVSDCTIRKHEYHVVWLHSNRPDWHWYEKIFFTFDFHILPQQIHTRARIIPCRCIFKKNPK